MKFSMIVHFHLMIVYTCTVTRIPINDFTTQRLFYIVMVCKVLKLHIMQFYLSEHKSVYKYIVIGICLVTNLCIAMTK